MSEFVEGRKCSLIMKSVSYGLALAGNGLLIEFEWPQIALLLGLGGLRDKN